MRVNLVRCELLGVEVKLLGRHISRSILNVIEIVLGQPILLIDLVLCIVLLLLPDQLSLSSNIFQLELKTPYLIVILLVLVYESFDLPSSRVDSTLNTVPPDFEPTKC